MTTNMISPAETVIQMFGGVRPLALLLGMDSGQVSRWRKAEADGGTGGRVPGKRHKQLLDLAHKKGKKLSPRMLIEGRRARVR